MTDRLELLPAVDVADGRAVRLVQGEAGSETSYGDPLSAALDWQRGGAEWIHLVDLDAAFGRGTNAPLLAEVAQELGRLGVKVELSGGVRDDASLDRALATGARRVNLGTAALEDPTWTAKVIASHGDAVAVADAGAGVERAQRLDLRHRLRVGEFRPVRQVVASCFRGNAEEALVRMSRDCRREGVEGGQEFRNVDVHVFPNLL